MDEKEKVIIECPEHVVVDGEIVDDVYAGGYDEEVADEVVEATDEVEESVGAKDEPSDAEIVEVPETEVNDDDIKAAMDTISSELNDLKAKYADLLSRFDTLIESGSVVNDEVDDELLSEEDIDTLEPSIENLDLSVDRWK